MGAQTGYASNWDKTDPTDVRQCRKCRRKMRHRQSDPELFPDTVPHRTGGLCSGCAPTNHVARAKTPEEEARRQEAARQVQEEIRARRARLGITPSGRKLPDRVMAG